MKCYICDKDLSSKEVIYNEQLQTYEPCTVCLDISLEAAFPGGFKPMDEEIENLNDNEEEFPDSEVPTLEDDEYRTYYDHCDINDPSVEKRLYD